MSYWDTASASGRASLRISKELRGFEVSPGITVHPLLGERMNINVVELAPNAVAPVHAHDEEQMGYVVSGACDLSDGDRTWTLRPGDTYHAPPGALHGATAHGDGCVIIDTFSPPREGIRELLG